MELEKEAQTVVEDITIFLGSLVHDDHLHQLKVQLREDEVQLESLSGLLKMTPQLAQVVKELELKEL